jgi:hypothetical protein
MTNKAIKAGLIALALGLAILPDLSWAQDSDYQTLASSQFAEPKPIGPEPVKVLLEPSAPLEAELASPSADRRILLVVRGTRSRGEPVIPVSVYWDLSDDSHRLDEQRLLGTVTLNDHFGGKDHTSVLDVTAALRSLSRIKEMPEPQSPHHPSVTLVAPAADTKNSGPQIEEVLLVASARPK